MTNFDMICKILRCDDLHAQRVYRSMVLGNYDFENASMENFVAAVWAVSDRLVANSNEAVEK